ncbi:hypothetical protein [Trinickia soli]|uniref:hypothetical protein n=1 Tax=Trinickia soli TaxID=380675 RepID=UPI003FA3BC06
MSARSHTSNENSSPHAIHSTLRESIVEHLFIGQTLQWFWKHGVYDVEVLRSEFDAGGYDLVMTCCGIDRYIQLKTVLADKKPDRLKASMKLERKPGGCIVCVGVPDDLDPGGFVYRWFGDTPDKPLPAIGAMQVAKHTKGDATGAKNERPAHRVIPGSHFEQLPSLDALLDRLFGSTPLWGPLIA